MKANNGVFPPHTTHWLQPADKAFFKSLKSHWTKEGIEAVTKVGGQTLGKKAFFHHSCQHGHLHAVLKRLKQHSEEQDCFHWTEMPYHQLPLLQV